MGAGSLRENHWWDFARGFLPAALFLKKTHVVLLIDWTDLLVGHCFEVALTIISDAPKYCVSDFLRHVARFQKGINLDSSYNTY